MISYAKAMLLRCAVAGPAGALGCALVIFLSILPPSQAQETPIEGLSPEAAVPADVSAIAWRGVEDGEEEARATGRLALYFFTADWCAPCHAMKRDVFSQPAVLDLIEKHYVPIEVLDRVREEGRNVAPVDRVQFRFLVDAFPTVVVARPGSGHGITEAGMLNEQGMERLLSESPAELERLNRGR